MQKDLSFKSLSSSTGADDGVTSAHNVAVKVNLTLRLSSSAAWCGTQKDKKGKKKSVALACSRGGSVAAPLGLCTQSNSSARPDAAHPDTWRRVTPLPLPRSNCMDVTLAVGGEAAREPNSAGRASGGLDAPKIQCDSRLLIDRLIKVDCGLCSPQVDGPFFPASAGLRGGRL